MNYNCCFFFSSNNQFISNDIFSFGYFQSTLRGHNSTRHFDQQRQKRPDTKTAYQCNICRVVQFSIAEIRVHMRETHPELQTMFCAKVNCAQNVANEEQLKYHWANVHTKFIYQCLKCFKRFEDEHFIENHMRNAHHIKMLKTEEN